MSSVITIEVWEPYKMFVEYDFFIKLWVWYPEYLKLHEVQAQISFELKYSRIDEVKFV